MHARIWSVTAQKGGVSKTTTAVNVSAAIALLGKRVLLCDLDPQSNTTLHLGVDPAACAGKGMYEVMTRRVKTTDAIFKNCRENLDLLPSHLALAAAEIELVPVIGREKVLSTKLAEVRSAYDHIVIDCPPGVGLLVANAFAASDDILLTVQPEYFALYGITLFNQLLDAVRETCNQALKIGGVLISMIDPRTRGQLAIHRDSARELEKTFGSLVFRTRIRMNARLKEAPSHGRTIFEHEKDCTGAIDYMALAKEMTDVREENRAGLESVA